MITEWHDYKSGRTGRIAGSYLYLPFLTEKNVGHALVTSNNTWQFHPYLDSHPCLSGLVPLGPFTSLAETKLHAACAVASALGEPIPQNLKPKLLQMNFDFVRNF